MKATVRIALCGTCVVLGFTVTTFAADTGPSINSPDPQERIRAVQNVSDQAVLAKVVEEDKDWQVISTAAYLLTDQTLLVKLALNASNCFSGLPNCLREVDRPSNASESSGGGK